MAQLRGEAERVAIPEPWYRQCPMSLLGGRVIGPYPSCVVRETRDLLGVRETRGLLGVRETLTRHALAAALALASQVSHTPSKS